MKSKTRSTIHLTLTTRIHLQYIHYYHKPFPTANGALFISLKVRANHKLIAKCSILPKKKSIFKQLTDFVLLNQENQRKVKNNIE
jgi:hypothetical protein